MAETTDTGADPAEARTRRPETPSDAMTSPSEGDSPGESEAEQPNREAARYRRQLREVEAERDGLLDRLAATQRAEVERIAAEHRLTRPGALWATVQLDDLLAADGTVDPGKVSAAVAAAKDTLGLALTPKQPRRDPAQGARPQEKPDPASWGDFLANRR